MTFIVVHCYCMVAFHSGWVVIFPVERGDQSGQIKGLFYKAKQNVVKSVRLPYNCEKITNAVSTTATIEKSSASHAFTKEMCRAI